MTSLYDHAPCIDLSASTYRVTTLKNCSDYKENKCMPLIDATLFHKGLKMLVIAYTKAFHALKLIMFWPKSQTSVHFL